jgi:hypothetical protein
MNPTNVSSFGADGGNNQLSRVNADQMLIARSARHARSCVRWSGIARDQGVHWKLDDAVALDSSSSSTIHQV